MTKPLNNLLVLDFSQFLSGSLATLRLADMGARVIKIERPEGELGRELYVAGSNAHGENTLFQAINRNKESYAANLKDAEDLAKVRKLIERADVMVQNFRPGVIERLGLGYDRASEINSKLVYATVTGYGTAKVWQDRPGQDLLAQARSGIMWLSGNAGDPPTPMALAIADMLAGHNLCEGILACLVRRGITGDGGFVETSLLESLLDFQFEVLTVHLNDGRKPPQRSAFRNAHAYLAAPYGVYDTSNGHLALAMNNLQNLGRLINVPALAALEEGDAFLKRDDIKKLIAGRLREQPTESWLEILNAADIWCAEVLDWPALLASDAMQQLQMIQKLAGGEGCEFLTTRCPIRLGQDILTSSRPAPKAGEHTAAIQQEFGL
jgi:CoA:oxalate CoA-transferase